jgi:hypothetical protein
MSKTDNYYVYVYLREDGHPPSPYYVGKGKDKRFQARHGRKYTNNGYWNPPKEENIRFVKTNLTDAEAIELEKKLIKQYGRKDNNTGILRNFTDGGEGSSGRLVKQKTRELWTKQRTGRKASPETCAKISEKLKGENNPMFRCEATVETRKKLSESLTGRVFTEEHKNNIRKGVIVAHEKNKKEGKGQHSIETRAKMRESAKRRPPPSLESRKKLSESMRAFHQRRKQAKSVGSNSILNFI